MASTVQDATGGHSFPIQNLLFYQEIAKAADKATNNDNQTSVPELEAYLQLIESGAKNAGVFRDELLARANSVPEAISYARSVQNNVINLPREEHQRLVGVARAAIADAMAVAETPARTLFGKYANRVKQAINNRKLPDDQRDAVVGLAMAMLRNYDDPRDLLRYPRRLLDQPVFAEAVTQARISRDQAQLAEVLRAKRAFGVRVGSNNQSNRDTSELHQAQADAARALTNGPRGRNTFAHISTQLIPLLTGSDEERARGNLLVQGLLQPKNQYWSSSIRGFLGVFERQVRRFTNPEVESGGFTRAADRQAYAIDLVQRLSLQQLGQLEPGTVRSLAVAITDDHTASDKWKLYSTNDFAQLTDEWRLTLLTADLSTNGREALNRLLGALPRGMHSSKSDGQVFIEFYPLPKAP